MHLLTMISLEALMLLMKVVMKQKLNLWWKPRLKELNQSILMSQSQQIEAEGEEEAEVAEVEEVEEEEEDNPK